MDKPLIHLVCGSTGAGKTTYSMKLRQELNAVHFSIDEWMIKLFGDDSPYPPNMNWIAPRVTRCERQAWSMAEQLGILDVPSILDFGFQRASHRKQYVSDAEIAGLNTMLHFIDTDAQERWRRVEQRNSEKGETYSFNVTRVMFDYFETIWEPPTEEELGLQDSRLVK